MKAGHGLPPVTAGIGVWLDGVGRAGTYGTAERMNGRTRLHRCREGVPINNCARIARKDGRYVPASWSIYISTASHQGWRHDHQGCGQVLLPRQHSVLKCSCRRLHQYSAIQGELCLRPAHYKRLWNDHGIRLDTKVAVYKAAVLTSLPYGSESWVLYRRHDTSQSWNNSTCVAYGELPMSSGRTTYQNTEGPGDLQDIWH